MEAFMAQFKAYTEVTDQKEMVKEHVAEERVRVAEEKVWVDNEKNELKEWEIMKADVESYPEQKTSHFKKKCKRKS
ncbi:hypothetical protein HanRHA438_Chr11g0507851 [Helianthus annuus]|nr:hypothetical protein HanRHA438_Chr11g0507851 [Helianthus annuus]